MGKKYIIELEEAPFIQHFKNGAWETIYRVKGFNSLVFDWNGLQMLTPYTEPDMEQVRKEAYEKGLSDAWDAARKIGSNSMCSLKEMGFDFSQCVIADYNPSWFVVKNYSASECIEKIRQYEQEKRFCVGDEFETESGKRFVIVKMDGTEIDRYIDEEGKTYCMIVKYKVMRKTGRHFPEIAEVLQKMKES